MLTEKYEKKIYSALLPPELIRPYPAASDRVRWGRTGDQVRTVLKNRLERVNSERDLPLLGTVILDSIRTGDLDNVIRLYEAKKNRLTALTLMECADGRGEYIERILDAVWSICDMAIWHLPKGPENELLDHVIDFHSAETGFLLAYVWYLFQDGFNEIDTNVMTRFRYEVRRRLMEPFMISGCTPPADILGEILFPFLIFEKNYQIRHAALRKTFSIADGSGSFNGGRPAGIFRYIEMLYMCTDGVFDVLDEGFPAESIAGRMKTPEECMTMLGEDIPIDHSLCIIFGREPGEREKGEGESTDVK